MPEIVLDSVSKDNRENVFDETTCNTCHAGIIYILRMLIINLVFTELKIS